MSTTVNRPDESVVAVYKSWYDYNTSANIVDTHERTSFITDTYKNLTDGAIDTTFVQGLLPNQVYRITFDIQKFNGTSWVAAETGSSENLTPTVTNFPATDALNQSQRVGFYWNSGGNPGTALYFKTNTDSGDGTQIQLAGFGNTRTQTGAPNEASNYYDFTTNLRQVSLNPSTGRPVDVDSSQWIPHSMDGYMFIFENPEGFSGGISDTDKWNMIQTGYNSFTGTDSLRDQYLAAATNVKRTILYEPVIDQSTSTTYERAKTYIGWNSDNRTQGVKIITDLQQVLEGTIPGGGTIPTNPGQTILLNDTQFAVTHAAADLSTTRFPVIPTYGSADGNTGGALRTDRQYIISLLFYDKISHRFITKSSSGIPKIVSVTIPYGGEWTISLGSFREFATTNYPDLTEASAMTVDISGLSVKGSVNDGDTFKIIMRATPVGPS